MYIFLLISDAVGCNRMVKRSSRADIETVVKLWLRYSCDRSGGRQARMLRQNQRAHVSSQSE